MKNSRREIFKMVLYFSVILTVVWIFAYLKINTKELPEEGQLLFGSIGTALLGFISWSICEIFFRTKFNN